MSYRDKVEGNELDLSLNQLTEVPVKELASATKATCLDLSCNRIQTLPNDFPALTHLVKIDLSQNRLSELPANFGNLLNLQHLDLYGNNIVDLPISFCRLKNLRWLDLKNNPLELKLKNIAGDCLDEKECQACAKKVVVYMQSIESDLEREKQKKLKAAKEKELIERGRIEKELEKQRKLKKLEKERRKAESKAKKEAKLLEDELQDGFRSTPDNSNEKEKTDEQQSNALNSKGLGCVKGFFYSILFACLVLLLGLIFGVYTEAISTVDVRHIVNNFFINFKSHSSQLSELIIYYIPKVKEVFLKFVYQYMQTLTYFASEIERFVAVYF